MAHGFSSTYIETPCIYIYIAEARKLEHGFRWIILGSLILYLRGMRIIMLQLSGFYYIYI